MVTLFWGHTSTLNFGAEVNYFVQRCSHKQDDALVYSFFSKNRGPGIHKHFLTLFLRELLRANLKRKASQIVEKYDLNLPPYPGGQCFVRLS